MKKFIEQPVVKVVRFESKDVITTSCTIQQGTIHGVDEQGQPISGSTVRIAESKSFGGGVSFSAAW